jgi:hypothetical protein
MSSAVPEPIRNTEGATRARRRRDEPVVIV